MKMPLVLPNKHSFKLARKERLPVAGGSPGGGSVADPSDSVKDSNKRFFLKALGGAGVGMLAVSLFSKRAEALVVGNTVSTVGLKNTSGTKINPATNEPLVAIQGATDKLQFDTSNYLKIVDGAAGLPAGLATQTTLNSIKLVTDNLRFSGDNLKTTTIGGVDPVGLKDTMAVPINPATEDSIIYLRRMVKVMESQATVDSANRQKITIDAITGSLTLGTVSNITTIGSWDAHQMYQDVAHNLYANAIRRNLAN